MTACAAKLMKPPAAIGSCAARGLRLAMDYDHELRLNSMRLPRSYAIPNCRCVRSRAPWLSLAASTPWSSAGRSTQVAHARRASWRSSWSLFCHRLQLAAR